jgi:hypothetical protein
MRSRRQRERECRTAGNGSEWAVADESAVVYEERFAWRQHWRVALVVFLVAGGLAIAPSLLSTPPARWGREMLATVSCLLLGAAALAALVPYVGAGLRVTVSRSTLEAACPLYGRRWWDVRGLAVCRTTPYASWGSRGRAFTSFDGRRVTMMPEGHSGPAVLIRTDDGETIVLGSEDPEAVCRALASLGVPVDPKLPFSG